MSENKAVEQEIVQRVLEGNTPAVRKLYQMIKPLLKKLYDGKVTDLADTDELIQDTFLHLLDALPLFRFQSNLWTFTTSIARHELADYWRKKYAKRIIRTIPIVKDLTALSTSELVSEKMNSALEMAYQKMKPVQVQLLRWKYEEGKSVKEMAQILGLTAKSVEAQLYRARKTFQAAYVPVEEY
jgi:RNA polymerase sigma-70 factor (ECF subfamily)